MPEAIAAAAAFVGSTGIEIAGVSIATSQIITLAATVAVGGYQRRKAAASARDAARASLKDREVTIRGEVVPRRFIFGTDRVGVQIVHAESTGTKKEFLHLVMKVADHQCNAITEIWLGDTLLPDPDVDGFIQSGPYYKSGKTSEQEFNLTVSGGSVTLAKAATNIVGITYNPGGDNGPEEVFGWSHTTGSATITGISLPGAGNINVAYESPTGKPVLRIKKHLGGSGQVADADLVAESSGGWTSTDVGVGICYIYARLEWDQDVWGSTGLQDFKCVVEGALIDDPRSSTTGFTNNAALITAHWLRLAEGLGASDAQVPDAEIIAAANVCDEDIDLNLSGTETQKRYTFDGSFTTDETPLQVLEDLANSMAGRVIWTQGRWLVRPGAYRTPEPVLSESNLAGSGLTVNPRIPRDQLYNAVRAIHRDPSKSWNEVQAPLVENSGYTTEDGGTQRILTIQVPTACDTYRAQRLAKIELEKRRQSVSVAFSTNLSGFDLAPTDVVPLDIDVLGWSEKDFEIEKRTNNLDGTLSYQARETAAAIYEWAYGEATVGDLAPDTDLPDPNTAPVALENLAVASGTAHLLIQSDGTIMTRAYLTWDQSVNTFVLHGGRIEVEWREATSDVWQTTPPLPGDAIDAYISPMADGTVVVFRVRQVNGIGRVSDWTSIQATIVGKSEPPGDVTGLSAAVSAGLGTIDWDACPDIDYSFTEIRLVDAGWGAIDADTFWRGAATRWQDSVTTTGTYTIYARHYDRSGNYSVNSASYPITITASDLFATLTIVATADPVFIEVQADADGVITDPFTGTDSTLSVKVNGVETIGAWTATPSYPAGFAGSYSSPTFHLSAAPDDFHLNNIPIELTRTGYPTQRVFVSPLMVKTGTGGTVTTYAMRFDPAKITIPAASDGTVTSFASAASTATTFTNAGVNDTANGWTFSKTDHGVTSTQSGTYNNTFTVTAWDSALADSQWGNVVAYWQFEQSARDTKGARDLRLQIANGGTIGYTLTGSDYEVALGDVSGSTSVGTWGLRLDEPQVIDLETGNLTIEATCTLLTLPGRPRTVVAVYDVSTGQANAKLLYGIHWDTDGRWHFEVRTGTTTTTIKTGSTTAVSGTKYHLAMVRNGNDHDLWVNGVKETSTPATTTYRHASGTRDIWMGMSNISGNPNDYMYGRIGMVRATRAARYTSTFTPDYKPPIGYAPASYIDVSATNGTDTLTGQLLVELDTSGLTGSDGITMTVDRPSVAIAADVLGTVPSTSLPQSVSVYIRRGAAYITSLYTASSVSNPSGVTSSWDSSAGALNITAMTQASEGGVISFTLSRTGYATFTVQVQVIKTKNLAPASAVMPNLGTYSVSHLPASGLAQVGWKIKRNGTVEKSTAGGAYSSAASNTSQGNWYNPTTTTIGDSYSVLVTGTGTGLTGTVGSWVALTSDLTYSLAPSAGTSAGFNGDFTIALTSALTTPLATGRLVLSATSP